jgi:predicted SAM-dependent methyltransferase
MIKPTLKYLRSTFRFLQLRTAKKIVLGASTTKYNGWVSTDRDSLNVANQNDFFRYWNLQSRLVFLSEHVWEHLSAEEVNQANVNCFNFLKSGGHLRIAVPDGFHPDAEYIKAVKPGGHGAGADDHKFLYSYKSLSESLRKVGFKVRLLEYWDEDGQFYFQEWDSKDGHIVRSKRFDPRNQNGNLTYTSLIVDAIKP